MEIALGVSMTPTTVRMVLVEGDKADGLTMDCDQFALTSAVGTPSASASEQVSAAILATEDSAGSRGHHLCTCGIALSRGCEADELQASLDARDVEGVILVSELQAAAALAHAVARAVGYTATGLLFIEQRRAVLAIVDTADCSITEVISRSLDGADPITVLAEMLASRPAQGPQGLFIVDSGGRASALKSHLEAATSLPIIFPEEPEWALARGAALAAAMAPRFEASTSGLAYAQDPDGEDFAPVAMETGPLARADVVTQYVDVVGCASTETLDEPEVARSAVRRFLSVGTLAASVLVIGVVAMVMALAASLTPTSTQRALEMQTISPPEPSAVVPTPPPATYQAAPMPNPSPAVQAPPPPVAFPTLVPPVALPTPVPPVPLSSPTKTVRVEQAPRTVVAQAPAPRAAQAPAESVAESQAPAVAPEAAIAPVAVDPPPAPEPVGVAPFPAAAPAPQLPAAPPSPQIPPLASPLPPIAPAPAVVPQAPILRWLLQRIPGLAPQQQQPVVQAPTPQWPQYQAPQWPQAPAQQWPQYQTPQWPQQAPAQQPQTPQWPSQPQTPQWPSQAQSPMWPEQPAYASPRLAPAPTLPLPQSPSSSSGFPNETTPVSPGDDGPWAPSMPMWPYR
jgi:hypothetical protein